MTEDKKLKTILEWFNLQKKYTRPGGVLICPSIYLTLTRAQRILLKQGVIGNGYSVLRFDNERLVVQLRC